MKNKISMLKLLMSEKKKKLIGQMQKVIEKFRDNLKQLKSKVVEIEKHHQFCIDKLQDWHKSKHKNFFIKDKVIQDLSNSFKKDNELKRLLSNDKEVNDWNESEESCKLKEAQRNLIFGDS